jgi:manganese oxidase
MWQRHSIYLGTICCMALLVGGARRAERIAPNDNAHRAGHLANGVLTVALEARNGEWRPEGDDGPAHPVAAFSEVGGALQTPGPIVRATVGTEVRVKMHNALTVPLWVYGLGEHRGYNDSVQVGPGESREMRFRATTPGLYYYSGRTTSSSIANRLSDDSQLNGAIAIDPPGAAAADRIFVISSWFTIDTTTMSGIGPNGIITFNGLAWPHTPRIDMAQGDTLHWRFVNVTPLEHPLHLHGSYYRVDAKGDGLVDSVYSPEDRRLAVTELVLPGQTMSMTWTPVHAGNWVFHCHISSHSTSSRYFEMDRRAPTQMDTSMKMHDEEHLNHMGALVIGIRVKPHGPQPAEPPVSQRIRLLVRSRANVYGKYYGYGFVRGDAPEAAMRDSFSTPGPTLELVRGKRVEITVVNQSRDAASVHWHGIELESFPDGVPGWSGMGSNTIPFILPGDSLTVRFTPPRAGTFIYHSHSNEMQQISSGLYGAIIVRDPAAHSDVDERTLLLSDDGPTISFTKTSQPILLNGRLDADTIDVRAGVPTRLRFINIRNESSTELALDQNGAPVSWRIVAKDGADLPAHQIRERPAAMLSAPGETFDAMITPAKPGTMTFRYLAQAGDSTTWQRAVIRAR